MANQYPTPLSLIGQRFGRLLALAEAAKRGRKYFLFCVCECGTFKRIWTWDLRKGHTISCGCQVAERIRQRNYRHGYALKGKALSEYYIWRGIKKRTTQPQTPGYSYYGGRGIFMCERWFNSFENFITDMGPKPGNRYTIDRIDNDGPYAPENCRWATYREQMNNKRNNHILLYKEQEKTISQWSQETGIHPSLILYRIKSGWTVERALTQPVREWRSNSHSL